MELSVTGILTTQMNIYETENSLRQKLSGCQTGICTSVTLGGCLSVQGNHSLMSGNLRHVLYVNVET